MSTKIDEINEKIKGSEALAQQKKELAEKGNYQKRAEEYIKAHGNGKVIEYRVVVEPWRETRRSTCVNVGTRVVAWAVYSDNGTLNFNFSIFMIKNKEYVNIKWAKGAAIEHALEKLFTKPVPITFANDQVAKAVGANLGVAVSSIPLTKLKTFTRVDKSSLHRLLREIIRLGRKTLDTDGIVLNAEISQEPIWDRAVSKDVKKLYHRHVAMRKAALALIAQDPKDKHNVQVAVEALKVGIPRFNQVGSGPLVKDFYFAALLK